MESQPNITPRYRRLRSTGARIFWHPCCVCGDINAPYGYNVQRVSRGRWVQTKDDRGHKTDYAWLGQAPLENFGQWYCRDHRPEAASE